ncbi:MAG TPA: cache domain-containing protein [Verrucomicrobiae bacterium]|nr:cache domain-containing protein [Verrucomicrobiae bacterium]
MTTRSKLTFWFVGLLLAANSIIALATLFQLRRDFTAEVQTRVRLDLNSARRVYTDAIRNRQEFLSGAALDAPLAQALRDDQPQLAAQIFRSMPLDGEFDILALLDARGVVLHRAHNPAVRGDSLRDRPLVRSALESGRPTSGTIVIGAADLSLESARLAQAATITTLQPDGSTHPTQLLRDGMFIATAIPIRLDNRVVGVLFGATLLNDHDELVDLIKDDVFQGESFEHREIGTTTLFLGDIRIATNVRTADGRRATGTRLSAEVRQRVIENGQPWADRAYVVNDWYITAYEPIRDPDNRVIGALYVGLLERAFRRSLDISTQVILITLGLTTAASLMLILFVIRRLLGPVDRIMSMCRRIISGDLTARTDSRPPGEMGLVCQAIDAMVDAVADRERQLKEYAHKTISESEKLASVGRLAAGVAHEINNPLTGVLSFAHLLREEGALGEKERHDIDIIIHETERVREIVRGLLDFARRRPMHKAPFDVNDMVRHTLKLVRSQREFDAIDIQHDSAEDPLTLNGDRSQIQQVLLNLCFNACEAMSGAGRLTIRTAIHDGGVRLEVQDTGHGIHRSDIERIFEPFFTTKAVGKGTGLGLSISYGIVQKHGGTFDVDSEPGKGSTFAITFPDRPESAATPVP